MKWVLLATVLVFLLLLAFRVLRRLTFGQATIHLNHMRSEDQALQVARTLKGLKGVVEVRIDLQEHLARITYRRGKTTVEEMIRALHAAGF
jgi:copper chaperone CopZ